MIYDKEEIAKHVCSFRCFVCKIRLLELEHFKIEWYKKNTTTSYFSPAGKSSGTHTGNGAILRFCNDCFADVAGEEFLFDPKVWK